MLKTRTPVINNKAMDIEDFIYTDGTYDYCIVNGESLTKYFGVEPGEYESYPLHTFSDPYSVISQTHWIRVLLKYDFIDEDSKYKKHNELMKSITDRIEFDLFGDSLISKIKPA